MIPALLTPPRKTQLVSLVTLAESVLMLPLEAAAAAARMAFTVLRKRVSQAAVAVAAQALLAALERLSLAALRGRTVVQEMPQPLVGPEEAAVIQPWALLVQPSTAATVALDLPTASTAQAVSTEAAAVVGLREALPVRVEQTLVMELMQADQFRPQRQRTSVAVVVAEALPQRALPRLAALVGRVALSWSSDRGSHGSLR